MQGVLYVGIKQGLEVATLVPKRGNRVYYDSCAKGFQDVNYR